jgi:teichoic acid transport system ATP-binding protein
VGEAVQDASVALSVEDVFVTYSVYEDASHRSIKGMAAKAFRPPPPRRVEAVKNVSFRLYEGEALGLIGRNGSGKSSLLRAVAGLIPVERGRILARSEPVLLGVGAALHPELSGRRNIYLGGMALGMSRKQVAAQLDAIAEFAGIGDSLELPLRTYSSGMNARLRFSVAAAVEPDVLLVDEALAVGDAEFKIKSEARMRELIRKAGALVLVSHSLSSVAELCSRVIWLEAGTVRLDGPAKAVISAYQNSVASP